MIGEQIPRYGGPAEKSAGGAGVRELKERARDGHQGAPGGRLQPTYAVLVEALRATAAATVFAPAVLVALSAVLLFLGLISGEHPAAHRWLGVSGVAVFVWLVIVGIFSERG